MGTDQHMLAVLTSRFGAISETFVQRHIASLCPGKTVVAARQIVNADWNVAAPLLHLRQYHDAPGSLFRLLGLWRLDARSCALHAFLHKHGVTTILAEWLNFAALWLPVARHLGVRYFAHAHGYDVTARLLASPGARFLYRQLHAMDGIITVSHLTRARLLHTCGLDPARVHVVPCGVRVPPSMPARCPSAHVRCIMVGRLVPKKGPLLALQAFQQAYRDNTALRLEIIGDGPLRMACEAYCLAQSLKGVVTLHGNRPAAFVSERLAAADIFLLHSMTTAHGDEEGVPVAILEAMAHGLPVVSTRHAGIPKVVLHNVTGLLVEERDWQQMGHYIAQLAINPLARQLLGRAGYQRAAKEYAVEQELARLREILFCGASE